LERAFLPKDFHDSAKKIKTFCEQVCFMNRNRTQPHTSLDDVLGEDVMQLHKHLMKSIFGKAALAAVVLIGILLFAGAPSAKANDWDGCNRRVAYAEFRLHQSIVYFGYYSPQAAYWRHERHEAYEELERYRRNEWRAHEWREHEWREHHRDYDEHRHYRDRDRDRDRDWDRD
jgi:hypothetical protein